MQVNEEIYIPISKEDDYDKDTVLLSQQPHMITEDLDLPFHMDAAQHDQDKFIKVRILAGQDWDRVNWRTGTLINPDTEAVKFKGAIIYFHGGGFKIGDTHTEFQHTSRLARETGYIVFTIDYRVCHDYGYPTPLSDCFQLFLWVKKYAKKYLQIEFDNVILHGDSAGGTLCLQIPLLCILKQCVQPEGSIPMYPIADNNRTSFVPSLLGGLDECMLSSSELDYFQTDYCKETDPKNDFILNPIIAPEKFLVKDGKSDHCPLRIFICGHDILRDHEFLYIVKMAKLGIDAKGIEFRHQMHSSIIMDGDYDRESNRSIALYNIIREIFELSIY